MRFAYTYILYISLYSVHTYNQSQILPQLTNDDEFNCELFAL